MGHHLVYIYIFPGELHVLTVEFNTPPGDLQRNSCNIWSSFPCALSSGIFLVTYINSQRVYIILVSFVCVRSLSILTSTISTISTKFQPFQPFQESFYKKQGISRWFSSFFFHHFSIPFWGTSPSPRWFSPVWGEESGGRRGSGEHNHGGGHLVRPPRRGLRREGHATADGGRDGHWDHWDHSKGLLGGDWLPWILASFPRNLGFLSSSHNWRTLIFLQRGGQKPPSREPLGPLERMDTWKNIYGNIWKRWRDTRYGSQISRNGVELWRLWSTYRSRRMDVFFLWMEVLTMVFEQPRMEIYVKVIDGYIMESWEESNHMKWRYHWWISPASWISHP